MIKRTKGKKKRSRQVPAPIVPSFRFIAVVLFVLFAACALSVLYTNLSNRNEISVRRIEERIKSEVQKQKELRVKLARVCSPERIARIAVDELGMREPEKVIFLRYAKRPDGQLISESKLEKMSSQATVTVRTPYIQSYAYMETGNGEDEE